MPQSVHPFYGRLPRIDSIVLMQESEMDIVWIAALVALWVAMAEAVVLLGRFDGPKGASR